MLLVISHHPNDPPREWAEVSGVRMTGLTSAKIFLSDARLAWFLLSPPTQEFEGRFIYHAEVTERTDEKITGTLEGTRHDLGHTKERLAFTLYLR